MQQTTRKSCVRLHTCQRCPNAPNVDGLKCVFSQLGTKDHKIEKESALVIMPAGLRIPLPCPQLPELVLNAINTITVGPAVLTVHVRHALCLHHGVFMIVSHMSQLFRNY